MIVQFDPSVDAAYIYLVDPQMGFNVARTVPCDPIETGAEVNLDFDGEGRLIGIEVLGASRHLPKALVDSAKRI